MYQASVVIPTHNRPHYLREALHSVVTQEGVDLDVIVIGDGAGEDAATVAREFPGVRYVWQPQAGPNAARNHAITLARHDCIALLDDDDIWLPGKMRIQLELMTRYPDAAYVFSDFHILRAGRALMSKGLRTWGIPARAWDGILLDPIGPVSETPSNGAPADDYPGYWVNLYGALLEHPYVLPTTAVFRKSFLTPDIRFVDHDFICGDWEFFARLSRRHPAIYMPVETACNRSHEEPGRLTRTPGATQLQCRLDMISRVWVADAQFMEDIEHRNTVSRVRFNYLLTLARYQLRDGEGVAARASLNQAGQLGWQVPMALRLAQLCTSVPGGVECLRAAYRLMSRARRLLRR